MKSFLQSANDAHFFLQPSRRGVLNRFAWPRMAATGIRPQTARVIFVERPLLQKHLASFIKQKNGNGAMQLSFAMRFEFFLDANLPIMRIDKDDHFVHTFPYLTLTRTLSHTRTRF
jgi:hypothetical protein